MIDDDERIIRETLQAGPTPGPWTVLPAIAGEQCVSRVNLLEVVPPTGVELARDAVDATYIAACSPDRIERVLAEVGRLRAELAEVKRDAEHLRSESVTLAGILRDCDAVLATIEPESTAEADSMADLRRAIAYALDPYGNTDNLPGIEPRRRIIFACPVCAASMERTP